MMVKDTNYSIQTPISRLPSSLEKVESDVLFLQSKITEVLGGSGYNTERLGTPYVPQYTGKPRFPFICFTVFLLLNYL